RSLSPSDRPSFPTRRSSDLAIRPHAHRSRSIKTHQRILGTVTNGDRLNLQKRRVNRYCRPVLNREMNRARVQRQSELIANSEDGDRKSTRLNSSHVKISYAV